MDALIVSTLEPTDDVVEIVERKGLGHPDTICDALAETLSRNLCREYRNRFGAVLHHNVDKALLRGGRAAPVFGGGTVVDPIDIYLAGRATTEVAGKTLPIEEIAVEGSRAWLRANLHALDAERHVHIHDLIRPGSQDLQELFSRHPGVALANDTAIGVGYAPLSSLERLVLFPGKAHQRQRPQPCASGLGRGRQGDGHPFRQHSPSHGGVRNDREASASHRRLSTPISRKRARSQAWPRLLRLNADFRPAK